MPRRISRAIARGPRVHLRPLRGADCDEFVRVARRSRSLHRPFVAPPCDARAFRRWMSAGGAEARARFVLCWNACGSIAGYLAMNQIVHGTFKSAYLGYWVARGSERQGVLAEGLELAVRHAFRTLRLHRLEANIQPANRASIALARGRGFRLEGLSPRYLKVGGRWRDHERWALTVEDWLPGAVRGRLGLSSR